MAFAGDLRTVEAAEVFQWVARNHLTGTLHLRRGPSHKAISFKNGKVFSSASTEPRERLGQFLVREGLISEEQLFAAMLRQEEKGESLGAILLADGVITEATLMRVLRLKAEEEIFDVFVWGEGEFEFHDGEVAEEFVVHLDLDVAGIVLKGAQRADDWTRIKGVIPSAQATFTPTGVATARPLAQWVLDLAATGRSVAGIAMELRRSEYETAALLWRLVEEGVLTVNAAITCGSEADPVIVVRKLLEDGQRAVAAHRVEDAVRAFQTALLVDPLNLHAKKGLRLVEETRGRKPPPSEGLPLDAVPALAVDPTRIVGQRLEPLEGFILSRVNGRWTVRSILKLCPVAEEHALRCFASLVARGFVTLKDG